MPTRIVLISPVFHGYWQSVSYALKRKGYDVTPCLYDERGRLKTLQHKALRELPAKVGIERTIDEGPTQLAIQALRDTRPDIVLAIRVDSLGAGFWEELGQYRRSVLWLYDELRRTSHTSETLRTATSVASYSLLDVADFQEQGLRAGYVPNAFDPTIDVRRVPRRDEVTFVGARYPNRELLLKSLREHGVPVRAYGRDWSDHPIDRLRTWRLRSAGLPSARDVSRADAYGVMQGSTATINMHFDQDGFTMRTFEAAGVGALQLIDRDDVKDFYEPGREIAVFHSPEEAAELAHRAHRDASWANMIRTNGRKRTLAEHTFDHRIAALEELWL